MKVVKSKTTYSYTQAAQPTQDTFSIAYLDGDGNLQELFNPVRCREYFNDFFGELTGNSASAHGSIYGFQFRKLAAEAKDKQLWLVHYNNVYPRLIHDGDVLVENETNAIACPIKPEWIQTSIHISYVTAMMRWTRNVKNENWNRVYGVWLNDEQRKKLELWLPYLKPAAEKLGINSFFCSSRTNDSGTNHTRGFYNFFQEHSGHTHDTQLKKLCEKMHAEQSSGRAAVDSADTKSSEGIKAAVRKVRRHDSGSKGAAGIDAVLDGTQV